MKHSVYLVKPVHFMWLPKETNDGHIRQAVYMTRVFPLPPFAPPNQVHGCWYIYCSVHFNTKYYIFTILHACTVPCIPYFLEWTLYLSNGRALQWLFEDGVHWRCWSIVLIFSEAETLWCYSWEAFMKSGFHSRNYGMWDTQQEFLLRMETARVFSGTWTHLQRFTWDSRMMVIGRIWQTVTLRKSQCMGNRPSQASIFAFTRWLL